jgi:predicted nuclease with TOPRIM domain
MADDPNNIVLEHLRVIRADVSDVREDMREVKQRLTSLGVSAANLHGDFAGQSTRIDRLESRLERIENRLDLRDC